MDSPDSIGLAAAPRGFVSFREVQRRDYIIAALRQSVRRYRVTLAVVGVAFALHAWPGAFDVPASADSDRPPLARIAGPVTRDADGEWCTPWEPTGESCAGGCWWYRYCTDCVPGCPWVLQKECRPSSSGCPTSPFLIDATP